MEVLKLDMSLAMDTFVKMSIGDWLEELPHSPRLDQAEVSVRKSISVSYG